MYTPPFTVSPQSIELIGDIRILLAQHPSLSGTGSELLLRKANNYLAR